MPLSTSCLFLPKYHCVSIISSGFDILCFQNDNDLFLSPQSNMLCPLTALYKSSSIEFHANETLMDEQTFPEMESDVSEQTSSVAHVIL